MRNGNQNTHHSPAFVSPFRSYPTYEEWKQTFLSPNLIQEYRSYPTYEEWKLSIPKPSTFFKPCSYPTYEEWKPFYLISISRIFGVLILPMRNGNIFATNHLVSHISYHVLILPMRNGNFWWSINEVWMLKVLILPMRNGNWRMLQRCIKWLQFLSYLWGMETYIRRS